MPLRPNLALAAVVLAAMTTPPSGHVGPRGRPNRRVLQTVEHLGVEYSYHATKGYRAKRVAFA
jgi:hypothetical protein